MHRAGFDDFLSSVPALHSYDNTGHKPELYEQKILKKNLLSLSLLLTHMGTQISVKKKFPIEEILLLELICKE